MINNSEAATLFVGPRYLELVSAIRPELGAIKNFFCYGPAAGDVKSYDDLMASGSDEEVFVETEEDDPAMLLYTSGTTALPKGVVLTHLTLSVYVTNTMNPADPEAERDVTLLSVPLYHVAGATVPLSAIWGGRTLVILPQFEPELWLEAVQNERVTHSFVVPTMLKRIMDHPDFDKYDLSSLQLITYGAAPMPYEVVRRAVDVFKCGLMNAYGQTESTSTMTFLGPEDHRIEGTEEEKAKKLQRLRSVGRAMDDIAIAIMNSRGEMLEPLQGGRDLRQRRPHHARVLQAGGRDGRRPSSTAGCTPATWATWTRTATSSSPAAPRTSSSAAARTSRRGRSRPAWRSTPRSRTPPSSACPTPSGGRR